MKTVRILLSLIGFLFLNISWAALPPAYLSVPHWKCCTDTILHATSKSVCLPKTKPSTCPPDAWEKLNKGPMLNRCGRE